MLVEYEARGTRSLVGRQTAQRLRTRCSRQIDQPTTGAEDRHRQPPELSGHPRAVKIAEGCW
jgi:hypothetical protein